MKRFCSIKFDFALFFTAVLQMKIKKLGLNTLVDQIFVSN